MSHVQIPPRGPARFVLPDHDGRAAAQGLRFFGSGRRGAARRAMEWGVSRGLGKRLPQTEESTELARLLTEVCVQEGLPGEFVIHLGPPRSNRKPVAVILDASGPTALVKVGMNRLTNSLVRNESTALRTLGEREHDLFRAPDVLGAGSIEEHEYLVQSVLPVEREGAAVQASDLARVSAQVAAFEAASPSALADGEWGQKMAARVAALPAGADRTAIESGWTSLCRTSVHEFSHGSWHGDLSPWNCISAGSTVLVWDWERWDTGIPVGFDLLHWHLFRGVADGLTFAQAALRLTQSGSDALTDSGLCEPSYCDELINAYLIEIATRFTTDNQRAAGSEAGRITDWLPPALSRARGAIA